MEKKYLAGTLIESKSTGEKALIEHSYKEAFGSGSHNELSVIWLDKNGNPEYSNAWKKKSDFNMLESNVEENLKKIRKYNKGDAAPIGMNARLAIYLGYSSIHTYESALANSKEGSIKL